MAQVVIENQDVLMVQCVSEPLPYAEGTKMEGKKYRRYTYGGKVFISNDETFYQAVENGNVSKITLDSDDEGKLSLTGYITFTKLIGLKKNNLLLESLTIESFTKSTTVAELEKLAV